MTRGKLYLEVQERLNIVLNPSPCIVTETVTAADEIPLLQTQEESIGKVLDTESINDSALNGRSWANIAQLAAGTAPPFGNTRGSGSGLFVTSGTWIALQMWEHYRFTGDKLFLRKRAYPVLKDAAEFFCAYMVEDPQHGWLVTGPSDSPENSFRTPTGGYANESMGPTCDRVLVHALFNMCLEAEAILSIDSGISSKLKQAQAKLAPLQIGRYGQLQEWLEDFEQAEPNHRHTSHLITLYPEHQISPDATPTLAKAARITLERRIHNPKWEDTEWSRANLVNYYAKLWDGEEAHQHLVGLIAKATDDNLLSCSRGGVAGADQNIFAIDDNTAGAAAVAGRFDSPVACTASGMARRICHWPLRTRRFPCRNALAILPARLRRDLQQGGWKLLCAPRRSTRPCSRGTGPSGTAHGEVVCRQAGISESC